MFHVKIWMDIPGWEGKYQVSADGEVKSLSRLVPYQDTFRTKKEKILKPRCSGRPSPEGKHYQEVVLCDNTRRVAIKVHILVARCFVNNPNALPCVMHKDDNPENNSYSNLKWGTVSDNNKDRDMKGRTYRPPSECPLTTLTKTQADEVKALAIEAKMTQEEIGKLYGIAQTTVSKIKLGISWN